MVKNQEKKLHWTEIKSKSKGHQGQGQHSSCQLRFSCGDEAVAYEGQ